MPFATLCDAMKRRTARKLVLWHSSEKMVPIRMWLGDVPRFTACGFTTREREREEELLRN